MSTEGWTEDLGDEAEPGIPEEQDDPSDESDDDE
jgi:hypothetical protein